MELKPCPFCGGEAVFEMIEGRSRAEEIRWSVGCNGDVPEDQPNCIGYQSMATYARKTDAAQAWNKRAAILLDEATTNNPGLGTGT